MRWWGGGQGLGSMPGGFAHRGSRLPSGCQLEIIVHPLLSWHLRMGNLASTRTGCHPMHHSHGCHIYDPSSGSTHLLGIRMRGRHASQKMGMGRGHPGDGPPPENPHALVPSRNLSSGGSLGFHNERLETTLHFSC